MLLNYQYQHDIHKNHLIVYQQLQLLHLAADLLHRLLVLFQLRAHERDFGAARASAASLVALQLLAPELSGDPAFAGRFAREARTLEFGDGTQTKASPEPSASATSLSDPDLVFKSEP